MASKLGLLFPGQGAQYVGMGKDLYEAFPEAKQLFDQADEILGYSIKAKCFDGPEEELTRTLYAQPAIFVSSLAAFAVLKSKIADLEPTFVAGLSLGEFSALVAGGALSFEDGLRLVDARARAMEEAAGNHEGTMASIMGLAQEDCEAIAQEAGCDLANLNSPNQFVMSGSPETIDKVCTLAEEKGAKRAIKLKVGGAFHSSLMKDAKENLKKALQETNIQSPQCTFVPNATAELVSDPEVIRDLLAKQLTSSVQWIKTMEQAAGAEVDAFLEIGPGKVLKGLARQCQPSLTVLTSGKAEELNNLEESLNGVETQKGS